MVRNFVWASLALILGAGLNLATIRKKDAEDPILRTQTDPIAYKEKMEEIKDGEKGAPAPSMNLYPKSKFLVSPPLENQGVKPEPTDENILKKSKLDLDQDKQPDNDSLFWEDEEGSEKQDLEGDAGGLKEEVELDESSNNDENFSRDSSQPRKG